MPPAPLTLAGFGAAAVARSHVQYAPYANTNANFIYNLLFCDHPDACRPLEGKTPGPWQTLLFSERVDARAVRALAEDTATESRVRALAYNLLRANNEPILKQELLGVIVEVGLEAGLDVLGVYADGINVRYINHSGKMAIVEDRVPEMAPVVARIITASQARVVHLVPREENRKPPPARGHGRITFLGSDGMRHSEGPITVVQRQLYFGEGLGPILAQTAELLQLITKVAQSANAIEKPTIAFLNLTGPTYDAIAAKDSEEIGSLFCGKVLITAVPVPICDVLFLYCAIGPSGTVIGQGLSLRDLIGKSRARVAVIASEVPVELLQNTGFQKSLNRGNNSPVNLVITGSRNGDAFGRFFKSLFQLMWTGVPMPIAWTKLAPQSPRQPRDIPGTICLIEAPQLAFLKGGLNT
jgi:hypothetical protein